MRNLIVPALLLIMTEARVIPEEENGTLWHPEGDSREDWMMKHGLILEELWDISEKLQQIRIMQAIIPDGEHGNPVALEADHLYGADDADDPVANLLIDNDILPTSEQVKAIWLGIQRQVKRQKEHMQKEEEGHHIHQRSLEDFISIPYRKWKNPIIYKFDGQHTPDERKMINDAFKQWEDRTCLEFQEFSPNAYMPSDANHVLITRQSGRCFSFVGRVTQIPQQLNLGPQCLKKPGTPPHEIGHLLGLWHEHQRWDRDEHIRIHNENVGYFESQFWRRWTISMGVPYDTTSVMHYGPKDGSYNGGITLKTIDPKQQLNIGQRVGLSFLNAKLINRAYCEKSCESSPLARPCRYGGYQDPKNCSQCRCADGFGGQYCQEHGPAKNAVCGGLLDASREPLYITSPGFKDGQGSYENFQECNWIIRAPPGHKVKLTFEGDFGLYCYHFETCYHWVEVKYGTNMEVPGGRMCCYKRPEQIFLSETDIMAVVFRSNFTTRWLTQRIGFRARVVAEPFLTHPREVPWDEPQDTEIEIEATSSPTTTTPANPPGTSWGAWGRCQNHECKCGGCSLTTRHRMCGSRKCNNHLRASQTKPCDDACRKKDKYLQLRIPFVELDCPVCCKDFRQEGAKCVRDNP